METRRQRSPAWLCCFLLLACEAVPMRATAEYRTVEIESLKIIIDSDWGMRSAPGYVPVRFDITNLGEARVIEIAGQGMRFMRLRGATGPVGFGIRQVVRLARGDRVRLTIPVPVYADNENVRFEIVEGNRTLERFNYYGFQSRSRPDDASALIVADPASAFGKVAASWPRALTSPTTGSYLTGTIVAVPGKSISTPSSPKQPLDFLLTPGRLPDNWLGFTSLRAVVTGAEEWTQLSDAQKNALLTWTACGGDLIFVDGSLSALFPNPDLAPPPSPDRPVRGYFFGRIHLPTSASVAQAGLADVLAKAAVLQDANWSLPANRTSDWGVIASRGFRLPIPGVEGVPARAYLFILIVFSLLIGPINYWVLWRKRQQVLVVLTTPLISVIFILLLAGYVVAGEGLGVRGRAVSFTMLDQVRKQAATRTSISLYAAGMAPSGGLSFARDEAIFPIGHQGTGSRESLSLDLTDLQRFSAGVIQARSPTNVETIGFRPARERLSFDRAGEGISVLNGLGTTVAVLIYREGSTIYSLAGPLPPGGKAVLKPGAPRAADVVPAGLPLSSRFEHLIDRPMDGSYFAVLERSPFWNPGVAHVEERGSFHVVIGWVRGQP